MDAQQPCLHLRSKEMFYQDPAAAPSEHDEEVRRAYGAWDTKAWWCQCTQTARGPDDRPVNRTACCRSDRPCYAGLEKLE